MLKKVLLKSGLRYMPIRQPQRSYILGIESSCDDSGAAIIK